MFIIYYSNQLDLLKELLIDRIKQEPLLNPLEEEQILVQSTGMAQWLRQELAEGLGIAASVAFPLPARFFWDMFIRILPNVPNNSSFNKETMTWNLLTLIPEMIQRDHFAPLRRYLHEDQDGVRCYQLASKVADIFDQYLVYRPEWIINWEAGHNEMAKEQLWQPELWRALVSKTASSGKSHWHRANMQKSFMQALQQEDHRALLIKRVFIFGISALPPHFIETLQALSLQTAVHLMVCNPCQYYWGDAKDQKYRMRFSTAVNHAKKDIFEPWTFEQSNPLLASMGKLGRDYMHQLHDLEANDIIAFVEGQDDSILHQIQKDILEMQDNSLLSHTKTAADDKSLVFHSCHSALREIEVLHDQLLKMFELYPELKPRDIIVMFPDVEQYSPWIQAVFGSLRTNYNDPRYIPFSIADRSARNKYPLLTGFLQLLDMNNSRCSVDVLLELLEIPSIQRQFDFTQESFETIRLWVYESGIRWGLSPDHQKRFDLPPIEKNSWLFGLKRMLLGYAMPSDNGLFEDILPLDSVHGINAVLVGQLAAFIEAVEHFLNQLETPKKIKAWILLINQLMDRFFSSDEDDEYPLQLVRESLKNLNNQLEDAGYSKKISRPILVNYLTEQLTSDRSSRTFLTGTVNFCTLMPMRSIPFKVICLLGMNDGVYPRSMTPSSFDLMACSHRLGDRSRKEDDRYLFLEALLSARKIFYISYIGHSIQDNSERLPSVLVSELMVYCKSFFKSQDIQCPLLTKHPLQIFNPDNFDTRSKLFSYAKEWLPVAASSQRRIINAFISSPLQTLALPHDDELEVTELLIFFSNPSQYFFNYRLKVYFDRVDGIMLDETEPFELDALNTYWLKHSLIQTMLSEQNTDEFARRLHASGSLPHGVFSQLLLEDQYKVVTPLVDQIRNMVSIPTDDLEINLNVGGIKLIGWLKHYRSGLIRFRPARVTPKDQLLTWIEHLCYCASYTDSHTTRLYGLDKQIIFKTVHPQEAKHELEKMVRLYQEGLHFPLPFFSSTAMAWLENSQNEEQAKKAAHAAFYDGFMSQGESVDPYIARSHPKLAPVYNKLKTLSTLILAPMTKFQKVYTGVVKQ